MVGSSILSWGSKLTGCIVSQVRRLALEVRGRKFESCHPDQFFSWHYFLLVYIVFKFLKEETIMGDDGKSGKRFVPLAQ